MNLMTAPNLNIPNNTKMTPAIKVATMSPASPYCWIIP